MNEEIPIEVFDIGAAFCVVFDVYFFENSISVYQNPFSKIAPLSSTIDSEHPTIASFSKDDFKFLLKVSFIAAFSCLSVYCLLHNLYKTILSLRKSYYCVFHL
ncbi:MAG: hypothetical protein Tsb004_14980 [Allomuricauda sp.]